MVETPLVAIEEISYALGDGTKSLAALATEAVKVGKTVPPAPSPATA